MPMTDLQKQLAKALKRNMRLAETIGAQMGKSSQTIARWATPKAVRLSLAEQDMLKDILEGLENGK